MSKVDILSENLCIQSVIAVIKGNNTQQHKTLRINKRHSDAFVYILSGSCTYRFDDGIRFEAREGDILYLPHESIYTMYIHTPDYKYIFCDFKFACDRMRSGAVYSLTGEKGADRLFLKLLSRYQSAEQGAYNEAMSILYRIYSLIQQNAKTNYLSGKQEECIERSMQYMLENFSDPCVCISSIVSHIGISEVYYRKLFKAKYHISPARYLLSLRLQKAKQLMEYGFVSVEECAIQSGFSTVQYFCRLFKKETGISPGQYRKMK